MNNNVNNKEYSYIDIYKKKFLVLKISGKLLDSSGFDDFVQYVKKLQKNGVYIILIYGGGQQISDIYEFNTKKKRIKGSDGLNETTKEIIENGVIPAYEKNQLKLTKCFGEDNINLFQKEDIICEQIEKLGEVGIVNSFDKEFSKNKINIIPFVGIGKENFNILNINARGYSGTSCLYI